jgi:hypothetical protein
MVKRSIHPILMFDNPTRNNDMISPAHSLTRRTQQKQIQWTI